MYGHFSISGEREKIGFRFKVLAIFVIFLTKKVSNDMISSVFCHFKGNMDKVNLNTVLESQHTYLTQKNVRRPNIILFV